LLEYMSGGTLVMPTMTWRTVTPQNPTWDELGTPSHTGVLSEVFRTRYAENRSIHPTHSVAARGLQSEHLLARHHLDETPVSPNSPYGLMRDAASYVLMIGVGLETCTAIRLPEETIAPDVYLLPLNAEEVYECRDRHGRIHRMHARRHRRLNRDFPRFSAPLAANGLLHEGGIAGCRYTLVGLNDLLAEVTSSLSMNRFATIAPGCAEPSEV